MKKTYIAPAISLHKLQIESSVLALSNNRALFGNKKNRDDAAGKFDGYVVPYEADEDWAITPVEGDDWSTL